MSNEIPIVANKILKFLNRNMTVEEKNDEQKMLVLRHNLINLVRVLKSNDADNYSLMVQKLGGATPEEKEQKQMEREEKRKNLEDAKEEKKRIKKEQKEAKEKKENEEKEKRAKEKDINKEAKEEYEKRKKEVKEKIDKKEQKDRQIKEDKKKAKKPKPKEPKPKTEPIVKNKWGRYFLDLIGFTVRELGDIKLGNGGFIGTDADLTNNSAFAFNESVPHVTQQLISLIGKKMSKEEKKQVHEIVQNFQEDDHETYVDMSKHVNMAAHANDNNDNDNVGGSFFDTAKKVLKNPWFKLLLKVIGRAASKLVSGNGGCATELYEQSAGKGNSTSNNPWINFLHKYKMIYEKKYGKHPGIGYKGQFKLASIAYKQCSKDIKQLHEDDDELFPEPKEAIEMVGKGGKLGYGGSDILAKYGRKNDSPPFITY
jgi:hypothetical protein